MMSLFPRSRGLCTSVPVKINVRRAAQLPTTLEVWNTADNKQIGGTKVIPLDSGSVDIRAAMSNAIEAEKKKCEVSIDHELRICITSPMLPPMNLVDLPGTVEHPKELRDSTHGLVSKYISEYKDSSMFIVVVKADGNPRNCGVMQHIETHDVASRTVGCFTFCDKLDTEEDVAMLKGWLSNQSSQIDSIPLEPYGYVATMNKEVRKKNVDETNHSRLMRQAQQEPKWFRDEGFEDQIADGTATAPALVNKIGTMYTEYVLRTFLPATIGQLGLQHQISGLRREMMGVPAAPGDLANTPLFNLRKAAVATTLRLIEPVFHKAQAQYDSNTLARLKQALHAAIPETSTVGIRDVQKTLDAVRRAVVAACAPVSASVLDGWEDSCKAALSDDAAPFRLQRFPQLVARLTAFCTAGGP